MINRVSFFSWLGVCLLSGCDLSPSPLLIKTNFKAPQLFDGHSRKTHSRTNPAIAGPPATTSDFDCFFVSVSGQGISPDFIDSLGGVDPVACYGVGTVSTLVNSDTLRNSGVSLSVLSGSNRTVQVYGVQTTLATSCVGKKLSELFSETVRPTIYKIGSAVDQTIVSGGPAIDVSKTFDPATTVDSYGECSGVVQLYPAYLYSREHPASVFSLGGINLPPLFDGQAATQSTQTPVLSTISRTKVPNTGHPLLVIGMGLPAYAQNHISDATADGFYRTLTLRIDAEVGSPTGSISACSTTDFNATTQQYLAQIIGNGADAIAQTGTGTMTLTYTYSGSGSEPNLQKYVVSQGPDATVPAARYVELVLFVPGGGSGCVALRANAITGTLSK